MPSYERLNHNQTNYVMSVNVYLKINFLLLNEV